MLGQGAIWRNGHRLAAHTAHVQMVKTNGNARIVTEVGEYTRLSNYVLAQSKTYETEVAFGRSTTTDDAEGEVLKTVDMSGLNEAALKVALKGFEGELTQRPPAFSAISVGGEKLYKKARRGEQVEVPERQVHVSQIDLLGFSDATCRLEISCSKGTYIRSIARDLGVALGGAAHCAQLRRTAVGNFSVSNAYRIEDEPEVLRAALQKGPGIDLGLPHLALDREQAKALSHGKQIEAGTETQLKPGQVGLAFYEEEIWAIVSEQKGKITVKRGFGKQL